MGRFSTFADVILQKTFSRHNIRTEMADDAVGDDDGDEDGDDRRKRPRGDDNGAEKMNKNDVKTMQDDPKTIQHRLKTTKKRSKNQPTID